MAKVQFGRPTITSAIHQDADEPEFRRLSAAEASELRLRNPPVSPWRVVAAQLAVGFVAALVAWGVTGQRNLAGSVAYGALAVVIPAALFARGMMGRFSSLNPASAAVGFFVWEAVKIVVSVTLLALAPRMVPGLSWLAMLIGLIVTMKVYWVALLLVPKSVKQKE